MNVQSYMVHGSPALGIVSKYPYRRGTTFSMASLTVVPTEDCRKRRFYSNFDPLNQAILAGYMGET